MLPSLGTSWRDQPAPNGVAFARALDLQQADWLRLRRETGADASFVGGDFNQDLLETGHYYGTANRSG